MTMRCFFAALLALLLSCGEGQAQLNASASSERTLNDVRFGDREVTGETGETITLSYAIVDPRKFRFLITVPNPNTGGASLARLYEDAKPLIAMNGGFLQSYVPATPAGLVQSNHSLLNEYIADPVLDGFLCFGGKKGERVKIMPAERRDDRVRYYRDCVQAGPLLVFNGAFFADLSGWQRTRPPLQNFLMNSERSFFALRANGEVVLGVTTPMSLFSLREVLLADEKKGGFGVKEALNLSTRNAAGLMLKAEPEPISRGRTNILLPNAILVEK